jgi:nicotinate-nucleotide adenylyltransferase
MTSPRASHVSPRIGILGGTFDPIHVGHLEAADAARSALQLDQVLLLPSRTPPHRSSEPQASVFHRFAMTALASNAREWLAGSDLELQREGPSYTALTLEELHHEGFAASQLFFIMGADAYVDIAAWYDYPRFFDLANFVVVSRPGSSLRSSDGSQRLPSGPTSVFFVEAATPDVSSTDIRHRVGAGDSIDGLVPPLVAEHIHKHRLYVPAHVEASR